MDYDNIKIEYNGNIYKMSGKCWYGSEIVRAFHTTINKKKHQLGLTLFTENEIDQLISGDFSSVTNSEK